MNYDGPSYEAGYRDGESSMQADYNMAMDTHTDVACRVDGSDDCDWYPSHVAQTVQSLEEEAAVLAAEVLRLATLIQQMQRSIIAVSPDGRLVARR
jgi:hypothetical protein